MQSNSTDGSTASTQGPTAIPSDGAANVSPSSFSPKEETMQSNTTGGSTASTPGSTAAPSIGGTTASSHGTTTASSEKATRASGPRFDTKSIEEAADKVIARAKGSSDATIIGDVLALQGKVAAIQAASALVITTNSQWIAAEAAWAPEEHLVGDALAPVRSLVLRTAAGRKWYRQFKEHDTWERANDVVKHIDEGGGFNIPTEMMATLTAVVPQAASTHEKLVATNESRMGAIAGYKTARRQVKAAMSAVNKSLERANFTARMESEVATVKVAKKKKAEPSAANGTASNGVAHVAQKPAA